MTEPELQTVERQLAEAEAAPAAAVAFAAIVRIGEIGPDAADAFGNLAALGDGEPCLAAFARGAALIEPHLGLADLPF